MTEWVLRGLVMTMEQDRSSSAERLRLDRKVAYIMGRYPILTTTFIDKELLEAKRLGLDMVLVAIRRANKGTFSPAVQRLSEEAVYLLPVSVIELIRAHFYFLVTRFRAYVSTLFYLLFQKHPSWRARAKTVLHFGEGILAAALMRDKAVDHVHAHFADNAATIAMVVHRVTGVPYSLTAHAVDIYVAPAYLAAKIGDAKFATTCTKYNKEYLERITGHRVELIYHGLDFNDIASGSSALATSSAPLILSVGRLIEKKGFPYLVQACAVLRRQRYEFTCEIVGEGPGEGTLRALIEELDLIDTVVLRGSLPHADVLREYSRATMFVMPCIVAEDGNRDGIPNVILEAMAYGLPVISTDVSGIPEVVRDQSTGWLTQPRNVEGLSVAMARVLDQPRDAAEVGQRACQFVRQHFDIRQNVGRLIQMFTQ
jgi:glycosyltransferase involved in cell wall biosynthesis